MKSYLYASMLLLISLCIGCTKSSSTSSALLRIAPTLQSRVTVLDFEENDCIGVTIERTSGTYAENIPLIYHSGFFVGETTTWYHGSDAATLRAYYPFTMNGVGNRYTVEADQSKGYVASDLLCASRKSVTPTAEPVAMTFYHVMSRLQLLLTNNISATIQSITLGGMRTTATIDWETLTATADMQEATTEIIPYPTTDPTCYQTILVPQSGVLTVCVTTEAKSYTKQVDASFQSGKSYHLALMLEEDRLAVTVSGDIHDWDDGGNIGEEENDPSDDADDEQINDTEEKLLVGEDLYSTCIVAGRRWMAENLRTLPEDTQLGNGLYLPYNATTSQGDAALVASQGYLYDHATALALCPEGWHLPSSEELQSLATASASFFMPAGLYVVQTEGGKYQSSNYLLGELSTEDATKCHVLKFTPAGFDSLKTLNSNYGCSVRYVVDEKAD